MHRPCPTKKQIARISMARKRSTLMLDEDLKLEINRIAVESKVFPCVVIENLLRLGLKASQGKNNELLKEK